MSSLAEYLRWLQEIPPIYQQISTLSLRAIVRDSYEARFHEPSSRDFLATVAVVRPNETSKPFLAAVSCYLLWHPSLRKANVSAEAWRNFFLQDLPVLSQIVSPEEFGLEERREELIRKLLGRVGLLLEGEDASIAQERLLQIDSLERQSLLLQAQERERRAKALRAADLRQRTEDELWRKITQM